MKTFVFSSSALLVLAGTAFGAIGERETEWNVLEAAPGFTGGGSGERSGQVIPFNVAGIQSGDLPGAPINQVFFVNVGPGVAVNGIGWDVVLTAIAPSWRSEIRVLVTDSTGLGGFNLAPGTDASPGGPTPYSSGGQILKLANYAIPDVVALGDGLIRLEFFESYDDVAGAFEGSWDSGALFLQVVPTPATAGLLGLAGVGLLGRKRR